MTRGEVDHIVCAVRGVPQSRDTVSRAIEMALQNEAKLTFLHVVDVQFLEHATVGPVSVVYNELVEMARFAMMILCDRARRSGVREAEYALREGDTREQMLQFGVESGAQMMIIGQPSDHAGRSLFKGGEFEAFVAELEERSGIRVFQVDPNKPWVGAGKP
jgi:nucleotide-binding universal stress UspA family protein